jgi:hypothetical protein
MIEPLNRVEGPTALIIGSIPNSSYMLVITLFFFRVSIARCRLCRWDGLMKEKSPQGHPLKYITPLARSGGSATPPLRPSQS